MQLLSLYGLWSVGDVKEPTHWCCGLALFHGLVLHTGLTSLYLSPWTELSKKNWYDYLSNRKLKGAENQDLFKYHLSFNKYFICDELLC